MLPQECPRRESADSAAQFEPALAIGGDMFDFLEYSGAREMVE